MTLYSNLKQGPLLLLTFVAFTALAVAVAACSGNNYGSPQPTAETPSTSASTAPVVIGVGDGALGDYLKGPDGRTLYIFTKDAPDTSNCKADCLPTWPPLLQRTGQSVKADAAADGTFASIETPSGEQVTYNGAPLYYFAGDAKPGDTNGHLVDGVWFVARPGTASTAVVGVSGSDASAYLVGPTGKTLYLFTKDTASTSNCTGQCLGSWPALTVPAGLAPTAVKAATGALALITRTDINTPQVTYKGQPLYYFAGDSVPGDIKGDGVGGVWTLAKP
jgi:predicted lipoprotein with Yx(FWY)xxD motif